MFNDIDNQDIKDETHSKISNTRKYNSNMNKSIKEGSKRKSAKELKFYDYNPPYGDYIEGTNEVVNQYQINSDSNFRSQSTNNVVFGKNPINIEIDSKMEKAAKNEEIDTNINNMEQINRKFTFDNENILKNKKQKIDFKSDMSLINAYEDPEIFYKLITSPLQRGKFIRSELVIVKSRNKTIYRMFLTDNTSNLNKVILYSVCSQYGKFYIGLGNKFNSQLGVKLNTIFTLRRRNNLMINHMNNNYLALMNMNLLKDSFRVILKEYKFISKGDSINEDNKRMENENTIELNLHCKENSNQINNYTSEGMIGEEKIIKNGDKLNVCSIQYERNFYRIKQQKLNVVIPMPSNLDNNSSFEKLSNSNKKNDLLFIYNNDLTKAIDKLLIFSNKNPTYNPKLKCSFLNFGQRNVVKSKKNFQLVEIGQNEVYYQFGKIDKNRYFFDFSWPFSPLQAFSIAISASV